MLLWDERQIRSVKHLISCFQIDSLTGLGVVKVECGSQFSVALTKTGAVYTWCVQFGAEQNICCSN